MARGKHPASEDEAGKTQHVAVASIADTSEDDVAALRAQIADLTEQLAGARSATEQNALATAESQHRDIQEVATGKTVLIQKCVGYKTVGYKDSGEPIKKPIFDEVEVPTYFYKVDIPPVGGEGLMPNGVQLYHNTVYEMDIDTLRSVKEQVYRLWQHEANISGSNENFYRRERAHTLSATGRRI